MPSTFVETRLCCMGSDLDMALQVWWNMYKTALHIENKLPDIWESTAISLMIYHHNAIAFLVTEWWTSSVTGNLHESQQCSSSHWYTCLSALTTEWHTSTESAIHRDTLQISDHSEASSTTCHVTKCGWHSKPKCRSIEF